MRKQERREEENRREISGHGARGVWAMTLDDKWKDSFDGDYVGSDG